MCADPGKEIQRRFKRACIWDGVDLKQTGGTKGTRGQIHLGKVERHFRDRKKETAGKRWRSHFEMKKERMLKELTTGNFDFAIISKMISKRVIVLSR